MTSNYSSRFRFANAVLGIVFTLMMSVSAVSNAQEYNFVFKWGTFGTGNGQFDFPASLATDSLGNIYVVDVANARIQKFDSSGNFLTTWGSLGSGDGQFIIPVGIAVDLLNNVYVTDFNASTVQVFTSSGDFIFKGGSFGSGDGQFNGPQDIAVDSLGNAYIVDSGNNRIQKFDSSGFFVTKWGSFGSGNGQFDLPTEIAVDSSNNVYVTDTFNHRIQKFSSSGNFLMQWGTFGIGDGQFDTPVGIAVDSSGNVYVTEIENNRIQKFDSSGNFLTKFGSPGTGDGQFDGAFGVAVNSLGNVYVSDLYLSRIQVFATSDPELTLSRTSISISDTAGSTVFQVTNSGSGSLNWALSEPCEWLTLSPIGGTNGPQVSESITITYEENAEPARRTCEISVTSNVGDAVATVSQAGIPSGDDPTVDESLILATFSAFQISALAQAISIDVSNIGEGQLNWTASESCDFVTLSPQSGTGAGTIIVTFTENLLESRICNVTIDSNGGIVISTLRQGAPNDSGSTTDLDSGGGGGGCFIATAAYGTPLAQEIDTLRSVRDGYLLKSAVGSVFVDSYYRLSPPIADAVANYAWLRALVQAVLTPIIFVSSLVMQLGAAPFVGLVFLMSLIARRSRKRLRAEQ